MKQTLWLAVPAVLLLTMGGCVAPAAPPATVAVETPAAVTAPPAVAAAIVAVTPPPTALPQVVPVAPPVPEVVAAVPAATVTAPPAAPTASAKGPQPAPPAATKPAPKPAATPAAAKAPAAPTKPLIFEASYGRVTFDHPRHAASHPCASCHATQPPGKFALGKEKAHQFCKGCHLQKGVPTQCIACHKKG